MLLKTLVSLILPNDFLGPNLSIYTRHSDPCDAHGLDLNVHSVLFNTNFCHFDHGWILLVNEFLSCICQHDMKNIDAVISLLLIEVESNTQNTIYNSGCLMTRAMLTAFLFVIIIINDCEPKLCNFSILFIIQGDIFNMSYFVIQQTLKTRGMHMGCIEVFKV